MEQKSRTNEDEVFPDETVVIQLVNCILLEMVDAWEIAKRNFSLE